MPFSRKATSRLDRFAAVVAVLGLLLEARNVNALEDLKYQIKPGDELAYTFTMSAESGNHRGEWAGTNRMRVDPMPKMEKAEESEPTIATGTGFFVTADGYLMTCAHVVKDAAKIEVAIDDKKYVGRVIAQDKPHDLALVKIDVTDVAPLPLADSDAVELGQEIRAIGFPLSSVLGDSMKIVRGTLAGVINQPDGKILQVDAGINPGNSGGPAVNEQGQVVGVVSAKLTGDTISNVGFVQPINDAKKLLAGKKILFRSADGGEKLEGPALFKRVKPSVALITVTLRSDLEKLRLIAYRGTYSRQSPANGTAVNISDEGHAIISTSGEVLLNNYGQNLPLFVGALGQVGLEQFSDEGHKKWQIERAAQFTFSITDTAPGAVFNNAPANTPRGNTPGDRSPLQRYQIIVPRPAPQADRSNPGSHKRGSSRSRVEMVPVQPSARAQQAPQVRQTTVALPALERMQYEIKSRTDSAITIKKLYEMASLSRPGETTHMSLTGEATLEIDPRTNLPEHYQFEGTLTIASERVKIKYSFHRADPATLGVPGPPPTPTLASNQSNKPAANDSQTSPGTEGKSASAQPSQRRAERHEVPTGAALAKAEKLVSDLFEKELAEADTSVEKITLAKSLLEQAHQQKPARRTSMRCWTKPAIWQPPAAT